MSSPAPDHAAPTVQRASPDEVVALLQQLIRNRCVNDGTVGSGQEIRSVGTLRDFFAGSGFSYDVVEPAPGRGSLIGRIPGSDPGAPSLLLLGHLDVVPVDESGWAVDPFGAELIEEQIWGRGAIDMLSLTAAMAVVTRDVAASGIALEGDLVFAAVADEEAGGRWGAGWLAEHRADALMADYTLTENGGVVLGDRTGITLTVGEKGGAPRRLEITGRPGHGAAPYGSVNAAVIAARAVQAIADARSVPVIGDHWRALVQAWGLPADLTGRLLDPQQLTDSLPELGDLAGYAHAVTHLTISPTVLQSGGKRNVIPGLAGVGLDVRLLPGQSAADVDALLDRVLAPWADSVRVVDEGARAAGVSPVDTPLYEVITEVFGQVHPGIRPVPVVAPGGSDGRFLRDLGSVVYGFGLYSPELDMAEFRRRLHGNDERIDLGSVAATTAALRSVVHRFLGEKRSTRTDPDSTSTEGPPT